MLAKFGSSSYLDLPVTEVWDLHFCRSDFLVDRLAEERAEVAVSSVAQHLLQGKVGRFAVVTDERVF